VTLQEVWDRQSVWSQTADRLKSKVRNWRNAGLGLSLAGAVLATAAVAVGLDDALGTILAAAGGFAVAVAGLTRPFGSHEAVQDWTRARSVAEGIKIEVFCYLTGAGAYGETDCDERLRTEFDALERNASALERHLNGLVAARRDPPTVSDPDTYVEFRLEPQIRWYRGKAKELEPRARQFSWLQFGLGILGAVLAAMAGATDEENIAIWVPVVTTLGAALAAHAAAERYDFLVVEYLRTASELERLGRAPRDPGFVKQCESVIAAQNQAWMGKFAETAPA
jgi:hypothetical protein